METSESSVTPAGELVERNETTAPHSWSASQSCGLCSGSNITSSDEDLKW